MKSSLRAAIAMIRQVEGGYIDHARDPGGCTNMGITLETYRIRINPHGDCRDLQRMTWETAAVVYEGQYWNAVRADALPAGIDILVFDHAVNAGTETAIRLLQRVLHVAVDGVIGKKTLASAHARDHIELIDDYTESRLSYYRSLKHWATFGKGWTSRARHARTAAIILAGLKSTTESRHEPEN